MPNWTLKQLESFVWIAKLGSFRAAGERLHTTQPNISVRISELEAALGVRLFHRDAGSVALTGEGQTLLGFAERALAAAEEFSAQAGRADDPSGVLRLGVSELVAQTWLRRFLREMKTAFPNVDVEVKVDLTATLRDDLVARALDLCLFNGPISNFNITNVELLPEAYAWVRAPGFPLAGAELADIAAGPILTHARNTRAFVELSAYLRDNWDGPARVTPSSSVAVCLQMALEGLGVALLPRALARSALEAGELILTPHAWTPTPLGFTASFAHSPASLLLRRAAEIARDCQKAHAAG